MVKRQCSTPTYEIEAEILRQLKNEKGDSPAPDEDMSFAQSIGATLKSMLPQQN